MELLKYDGKHVRLTDIYGKTFTGMARYGVYEFLMHEYGGVEDGLFIEDYTMRAVWQQSKATRSR